MVVAKKKSWQESRHLENNSTSVLNISTAAHDHDAQLALHSDDVQFLRISFVPCRETRSPPPCAPAQTSYLAPHRDARRVTKFSSAHGLQQTKRILH